MMMMMMMVRMVMIIMVLMMMIVMVMMMMMIPAMKFIIPDGHSSHEATPADPTPLTVPCGHW